MKYEGMQRPKAKAKEPSLDTARDSNRICRVEKTYKELKEQGERFRATIYYTKSNIEKLCSDLKNKEIRRVILIGCGDSWFVGSCVEVLIERLLNCSSQSFDAYEFCTFHFDNLTPYDIVVGQSASGTTVSVLNSINRAKQKGAYTIGISNTENAQILNESDFGLLVQAERKGWPTQATTAAIGAISYMFSSLAKVKKINSSFNQRIEKELLIIGDKIDETIAGIENIIRDNTKLFTKDSVFQSTGSGPLYGASQVAAAKLKELCPVHAFSYPIEEFHHYRSLKKGDSLILFTSHNSTQKEIDTALVGAYDGGKIIVIGPSIDPSVACVADLIITVPSSVEELQPIISMIASHLFAYYLAIDKYNSNIGYPSEE